LFAQSILQLIAAEKVQNRIIKKGRENERHHSYWR
jgi:hypothetical protein